jgi:bacillithiol biosynthesis deacetylase BshB1
MIILVIGPHPDDQELGMGATIAALVRQHHQVTLLDMTNGEPTPFGSTEIRARESAAAAEVLGVKRLALGLKNREVTWSVAARHAVAAVLRQVRPDIVFLPYPADAHPDHRQVTEIVEDARFDAKLTRSNIPGEPYYPPRLIYYFCTHLRINFPATFCLDVTQSMDIKLAALRCYESQFSTGRASESQWEILKYIENINAYFGGTIRRKYAEPFFVQETLGLQTLDGLAF